eukprot:4904510-Pyramimonas_sp.AAC.1
MAYSVMWCNGDFTWSVCSALSSHALWCCVMYIVMFLPWYGMPDSVLEWCYVMLCSSGSQYAVPRVVMDCVAIVDAVTRL